MIFFWAGYKKMNAGQLETSLQHLSWSENNPRWPREDADEHAILALLKAVILRNLRRHEESKDVLRQNVLNRSSTDFVGQHKDDWMVPTAHHEMAVNLWMQRTEYNHIYGTNFTTDPGAKAAPISLSHDAVLVKDCQTHLEKAKNWGKYELDARLGLKITAALNAVKKWETKHPNVLK
jgi:hypothetical protein